MGNVSRDGNVKNQKKTLDIKNTAREIKNSFAGLINRINKIKERIGDLKKHQEKITH